MTVINSPLGDALRDRYLLERELGRGGMATVYLAKDIKHKRYVALKVLHAELSQVLGPERFHREIEFAARLQHPHILGVHDSGEAGGRLWFTMPYVKGQALRDRLRKEGPLAVDEALRITQEAAQALAYAHREGVIHRDVRTPRTVRPRAGASCSIDGAEGSRGRRRCSANELPPSRFTGDRRVVSTSLPTPRWTSRVR